MKIYCIQLNVLGLIPKFLFRFIYEGESVNRSQMDIKCKTCDIWTWEKHLFLDISSANIDTLVPSLYQCVETRSMGVFWLLSQLRTSVSTSSSSAKYFPRFPTQLWTRNISLLMSFASRPFAHKKAQRTQLFCSTPLKHGRHFDY
jgi:hypothetical protein